MNPLVGEWVLEFRPGVGNNANFSTIPETDDLCNARAEQKPGVQRQVVNKECNWLISATTNQPPTHCPCLIDPLTLHLDYFSWATEPVIGRLTRRNGTVDRIRIKARCHSLGRLNASMIKQEKKGRERITFVLAAR